MPLAMSFRALNFLDSVLFLDDRRVGKLRLLVAILKQQNGSNLAALVVQIGKLIESVDDR